MEGECQDGASDLSEVGLRSPVKFLYGWEEPEWEEEEG